METIQIDILNPKAKSLLDGLAELGLISIKKEVVKSDFKLLLDKLRINADSAPTLEDITQEVEAVRETRYEK